MLTGTWMAIRALQSLIGVPHCFQAIAFPKRPSQLDPIRPVDDTWLAVRIAAEAAGHQYPLLSRPI